MAKGLSKGRYDETFAGEDALVGAQANMVRTRLVFFSRLILLLVTM